MKKQSSSQQASEINLEYGMPTAGEALAMLKREIESHRARKTKCLTVIHGYGSSGKGGVIRNKAREWLKAQEKNGKVKTVIFGEDFDLFHARAPEMKNKYPSLSPLLNACNHGVTIVEL